MKYAISLATLAALATASPVIKREVTDVAILNYALTLEHLEDKFYREGLANYTQQDFVDAGFADPFYDNLREISYDETTHVNFLSGALADAAVEECTYSFPSTDPKSFVALASVLEGVGVSAYLGAAASIMNKDYLTAAGSILTVEARHNAYVRSSLTQAPFPKPFDAPLTFSEVYTLAATFFVSCPDSNADKPQLPFKPFPALTIGTDGPIESGDDIVLLTEISTIQSRDHKAPKYAAFISVTGPVFTDLEEVEGGYNVKVPEGFNGQSYVVLTTCNKEVTDDTTVAGPAIVEITNPYPSSTM